MSEDFTREEIAIFSPYVTNTDRPIYAMKNLPMEQAADAYNRIAEESPLEAPYVLPLAYRIRVLFSWNLHELYHFIQLCSAKQGHFSYRRIAQQVYAEIERIHPALACYIQVDQADYQLGRL
jgi:thymidylate synthase ThyX